MTGSRRMRCSVCYVQLLGMLTSSSGSKYDSFRANLVELPVQIGHFLVGTVLDRLRITIILICMQRLSDNYST